MSHDPDDDTRDAALLKQFLAGRDRACPQCEYNLRDLTGTRCPECGEELTLRLQPVEPRQAALLAGLIAISAGAGLNLLLLGYVVISRFLLGRGGDGMNAFILVNFWGLLVTGSCAALWLTFWKKIRRLNTARRWMLAATCAILSLSDLIIFTKLIR